MWKRLPAEGRKQFFLALQMYNKQTTRTREEEVEEVMTPTLETGEAK